MLVLTKSVKRRSTPLVLRSRDASVTEIFVATPIRALGESKRKQSKIVYAKKNGQKSS